MRRIVLMALRNFFIFPFWFYRICKYGNHPEKYDANTRYSYLSKITKRINKTGRVKIECTGLENLPKETGYILFPNHQGLFDALAFLETHERPFATISKKEVQNVFLVKQVFRLLHCIMIDREDVKQAMMVIREVAKEAENGRNFILFAEGTRSKNGNHIGEFKAGSFKSAYYAKCPIVPVALLDSYKVFDTHSLKKVTVQIHYLEPLYYEDYKDLKTHDIAKIVEKRITEAISKAEAARGNEYTS
ncbi:lysophospholipid acyltransferase family protein [Anaerosporobacter faecicola]|uniref:lysophospholipid acyltransferase family protein n=1 Tax=Anaerosporobacter faecicola TaxID=2718714 RepID=UPI001439FEA1|nr:lysophospholipid acyltransferase family protein [Anaerosporobacter faecicola]